MADYVQLVFDSPAINDGLEWALAVRGDDGTMFLSSPAASDSIQFFIDGTTLIPELRDLRLGPTDTPPGAATACTSGKEVWFYWDDSLNELRVCNGSSRQQVDGGGAC